MTDQSILVQSLEAISRANADLSEHLIKSAQGSDKAIEDAIRVERERCAKIAEIPHMTPADIARVIRNG